MSLSAEDDQAEYDRMVIDAIRSELRERKVDFADLAAALPGVYPQTILQLLQASNFNSPLDARAQFAAATASLKSVAARSVHIASDLPHPLDFDWRFTAATCDRI